MILKFSKLLTTILLILTSSLAGCMTGDSGVEGEDVVVIYIESELISNYVGENYSMYHEVPGIPIKHCGARHQMEDGVLRTYDEEVSDDSFVVIEKIDATQFVEYIRVGFTDSNVVNQDGAGVLRLSSDYLKSEQIMVGSFVSPAPSLFNLSFIAGDILINNQTILIGDSIEGELEFEVYSPEAGFGENTGVNSTIKWKVTVLQLDQIHSIPIRPCE